MLVGFALELKTFSETLKAGSAGFGLWPTCRIPHIKPSLKNPKSAQISCCGSLKSVHHSAEGLGLV